MHRGTNVRRHCRGMGQYFMAHSVLVPSQHWVLASWCKARQQPLEQCSGYDPSFEGLRGAVENLK